MIGSDTKIISVSDVYQIGFNVFSNLTFSATTCLKAHQNVFRKKKKKKNEPHRQPDWTRRWYRISSDSHVSDISIVSKVRAFKRSGSVRSYLYLADTEVERPLT